ncbi:MAG: hypothetical protein O2U61_00515 [Candidatus Bathyarchaeota archaeon]|nr:hypothetical protein [Candidatus Bathyarchaeota archaeon]MCZ2844977.1 hypothetical protein [Candidatus Bathyarchaeota archaeon]
MSLNRRMAIATISIAILLAISALYIHQFTSQEGEITKLTWNRSGGFIGLNEKLTIESDGSAMYKSNLFGDGELDLTESEFKDLQSLLKDVSFFELDDSYDAKMGTADYFTYRLTVHTTSDEKTVEWVDSWAAEKTLPRGLEKTQIHIQSIIEEIHLKIGASREANKRAIEMAKNFIVQAPTFKFDGILDTLNVTDSRILESFSVQYIITLTFNSRHAGYGNREGQILAQVITPHIAVVKVVNDNVVSAIMDNKWDELHQEFIP